MADHELEPGLYEALLTGQLADQIAHNLDPAHRADLAEVPPADAPDRLARHIATVVERAISDLPEDRRATDGAEIARRVVEELAASTDAVDLTDAPSDPLQVLAAILRPLPDGSYRAPETPLTPLLDTTLLTNAPGEPTIGHELRAEIESADAIDVVMAFVRWSGIRPLVDALLRHCQSGKRLRLVTTTYTNSTELRALESLYELGADIRVSYDTASTRLHAKAWLFHRRSGYSTAYIGSSNLTHSAMVSGLEWNVRVSGARNPDVVAKMDAVFASYWASRDFVPFDADQFRERTETPAAGPTLILSPVEIVLRPFQERLLEQINVARELGRHRNLLVAATGTGKTVMAAVDYAQLRRTLPRDRLLFVAHRAEILTQSQHTFQHALRDPSFGEQWVRGQRPRDFDHVFASVQSLSHATIAALEPDHFDVVIIDEFHHAAAPSYRAILDHLTPRELLGLTATPERTDGVDILGSFGGEIAAELRVWDAIDQGYLTPFAYYGIHDGIDLTDIPWKRGVGYDPTALTNVLTADHVWARRVIEQLRTRVGDVQSMRALGFCVTVAHAHFMAEHFRAAGIAAVAISGESAAPDRAQALAGLSAGRLSIVFTVDLFNEGVDLPNVDTLLMLRPTESATLFLQQLGRGLRRSAEKAQCTVLDFVGMHRREFRFDRRFRALLGGSRRDIEEQTRAGFPFLPAGCHLELDRVAEEVVLRSLREAIPSGWPSKVTELRSLGNVSLRTFLDETGLDVDDVYASGRSWSELRRAAGLPTDAAGPHEAAMLRAIGRQMHIDDSHRIADYRALIERPSAPKTADLSAHEWRIARMIVGSLTTLRTADSFDDALLNLWSHPQVRAELLELLDLLPEQIDHLHTPLDIEGVPLAIHARYTRTEIFGAFGIGDGAKPPPWQTGVRWDAPSQTDLFAFTLDKSSGGFSPTTRYRDYAISPELIHWESQSATRVDSPTGQRYVSQAERGTHVVLFARLRRTDAAFWCLGPATYVSHTGDRPIAITWRLHHRLPGDLYASFAAAVA